MSESDREDFVLLDSIRGHDEAALQRLLRKYYERLARYAYSVLRRRDLAQEAVDNVFLNLWRRRETLTISANLRSFLYGAVSYQSLNLLAKENKVRHVAIDDVPSEQLREQRGADSDLLMQELQSDVDALLASMPAQRQLIFRLNRIEGLRYREIAEALGLSERTVQNHMLLAIEYLTSSMERFRNRHGQKKQPDCETGR